MLSNTPIQNEVRNPVSAVSRTLSTEQVAALLHVRPQSLRAALCRNGHYLGVVPIKLPNRLLAWPADQIEAVLCGEVVR